MNYIDLIGMPVEDVVRILRKEGVSPVVEAYPDETNLCLFDVGVCLSALDSEVITRVEYYARDDSEFRGYRGELPFGLTFSMKRPDVAAKLGAASFQFEGGEHEILRSLGPSDAYLVGRHEVSLRYRQEGGGAIDNIIVSDLSPTVAN